MRLEIGFFHCTGLEPMTKNFHSFQERWPQAQDEVIRRPHPLMFVEDTGRRELKFVGVFWVELHPDCLQASPFRPLPPLAAQRAAMPLPRTLPPPIPLVRPWSVVSEALVPLDRALSGDWQLIPALSWEWTELMVAAQTAEAAEDAAEFVPLLQEDGWVMVHPGDFLPLEDV